MGGGGGLAAAARARPVFVEIFKIFEIFKILNFGALAFARRLMSSVHGGRDVR